MPSQKNNGSGKLKIGNDWNAITIIALSQNNPLKAIAEFVENSIDARASHITLIRGKQKGEAFLRIIDDGEGIADLTYVATHIGDSIKRKMKQAGVSGLQGEFGIGLMSFWTVGEELTITSVIEGGSPQRMKLVKGNPGYHISPVNSLFALRGTELLIAPILPGLKALSGERIQGYLASELRDRIARSGVQITIIDKLSRMQYEVEPRKFSGRLLHNLPEVRSPFGDIYCEIYLNEPSATNELGLYKSGTRVIPSISNLDMFDRHPWNSPYLEGIIDCPFLQLTPGTRDGIIRDDAFENLSLSLEPLAQFLTDVISEQKRAEEEKASSAILSRVTKAFREAFTYLGDREYAWLDVKRARQKARQDEADAEADSGIPSERDPDGSDGADAESAEGTENSGDGSGNLPGQLVSDAADRPDPQKSFFEFPGPLFSLAIIPAKQVVSVDGTKKLRAVAKDRKGVVVDHGLEYEWHIIEGDGSIDPEGGYAVFHAPEDPSLVRIKVQATDGKETREAEALITVTAELLEQRGRGAVPGAGKGLPGYTYVKASGELWRSQYRVDQNVIVINNGHPDFIFASRVRMRQLRYIARLFVKEMVLYNFPGIKADEALERMAELLLYIEENL